MHDRYNPRFILVLHDDGTWVRATRLHQHRADDGWRVTVSYAVDGFTYWRGMPASECRALGG